MYISIILLFISVMVKIFFPSLEKVSLIFKVIVFFLSLHGLKVEFDIFWILGGIVAGNFFYLLSVTQIKGSLQEAKRYFLSSPLIMGYYLRYPEVFCKYLVCAIFEEVIWRYFIQSYFLTFGVFLAILITAISFTLDHFYSLTNKKISYFIEFLIFSFILGLLFYFTNNLLLVIFIHLIRNCNIMFYKQLFVEEDECKSLVISL